MKKTINLLLSSGWFMILVVAASVSGMFTIYNQASTGASYFHHAAADNGNNGSNAATGGGTGRRQYIRHVLYWRQFRIDRGRSNSPMRTRPSTERITNWRCHCTSRWLSKEMPRRKFGLGYLYLEGFGVTADYDKATLVPKGGRSGQCLFHE